MLTGVMRAEGERKESSRIFLWLILAGGAFLRFYGLAAESFWFDETYSVWVARHSVAWHLALSTQRIFPPLYYLILHFWLFIGQSDWIVRALSALAGVVSLWVIYALGKRLFDQRTGLVSAFLLAISPLHIWFSQEARMYILVALLGLCSAYFMWRALEEGRFGHWAAYVICAAAATAAHYFALFFLVYQNAYVAYWLLRRPERRGVARVWLVSQVAAGVLSLLGLLGILSAESRIWWGLLDTWHGAPTLYDLLNTLYAFCLGTVVQSRWLYLAGLGGFGICAAWSLIKVQGSKVRLALDDGLVFALMYLIVPVGTVFAMSQFRSSWVLRYLFPFLPGLCLVVARGITHLPDRWWRLACLGLLLVSLWPLVNTYRYTQKEDWRAAAEYVTSLEQPGDVMFLMAEDIWLPFDHYYQGAVPRQGIGGQVSDRDWLAARVGLASSHPRIWLVLSHTNNLALKEFLLTSGYTALVSEKHFHLLEVDLFTVDAPLVGGR